MDKLNLYCKRGLVFFWALLIPVLSCAQSYTVAVVPQFPAVEIHRAWTPLLAYLSAQTGLELKLVTSASIPEFERSFQAGQPDLVFLNPYHMVMASKSQQYMPLVRESKELLAGIVVVRADSPVKNLSDLSQQTIAYPAPNAFGASLYIRSLLAEQKIQSQANYVKTHSNAYRHVIAGQAAAAGGIRSTLDRELPEVRAQLRVLFETPAVAPHPLAAHPRVSEAHRKAIREAWLSLAQNDAGLPLLKAVQMTSPVAADYKRDYAPLERLRLEQFAVVEGAAP
ncbi:MAG: phosphate/phosphite/phosphonate ABC transporter substrate-binding protein [Rhizobacter sp.]